MLAVRKVVASSLAPAREGVATPSRTPPVSYLYLLSRISTAVLLSGLLLFCAAAFRTASSSKRFPARSLLPVSPVP